MGLDVGVGGGGKKEEEPAPAVAMSKEKVLKEIREREKTEKPTLSLVVVGACLPSCLLSFLLPPPSTLERKTDRERWMWRR